VASKIERRSLAGDNPVLEINLKSLFPRGFPNSRAFKESIGQGVIDRIRDRTADNIDRRGQAFKEYSQQYTESLEFIAAGKAQGDPNLRLSGDMLNLMDIIETRGDVIKIGWRSGDEAAKAHGHITGSDPGPKVQRDFFGLPDDDYREIAQSFTVAAVAELDVEAVDNFVRLGDLLDGEGEG